MFSKTLFAVVALLAVNAQTITSPAAVIQCQPARFTLSGGTPPYIVDIIPGGDVSAPAIGFIGSDLPAGGLTWTPDLPAGSNVTFRITDSQGTPQYSSPTVIQAGNSDSCLNSSATSGIPTGAVTTTNTQSISASSTGSLSSASSAVSNSVSSASNAVSSVVNSATSRASSMASSMSASGGNAASSASSVAASATQTPNGAMPTGYAGAGAIAAGVIGGVAMLF